MTPLPLPRFTFLFGHPDQGQYPLAAAIASQSLDLAVLDLEEPLRDAAHVVAFNGTDPDVSFDKNEDRQLPMMGEITIEGWMEKLDSMHIDLFGLDWQAQFALKNIEREGLFDVYDRFLFRDAENMADVNFFRNKFGSDNCLILFCGPLPAKLEGLRFLWLSTPSLENRMAQLRKELENVPTL